MQPLLRILFVALCVLVPARAFAEDADALYRQGLALKEQGKNDEAIKKLEEAVAANPRHGMAWASLGHLYKQKQDLPEGDRGLRERDRGDQEGQGDLVEPRDGLLPGQAARQGARRR